MKKVFTMLALALVAVSASAQESTEEKALFAPGETYVSGSSLTTENTELVLGNDPKYKLELKSVKTYCANLFGQTVMIENAETGVLEEKVRVVTVTGSKDPKDGPLEEGVPTGILYNPDLANLPQSGAYFTFTPEKAGTIVAFIILNKDKSFFVAKKSDGSCLSPSELTLKADGDTPTEVTLNDDYQVAEKLNGTVEFKVEAGETYYLFCNGSKLGLGGYIYTPEEGGANPGGGGGETPEIFGDLNNDGKVNMADVTTLINYILTGKH